MTSISLGQKSALNDFGNILRVQRHPVGEARLDFREVIFLLRRQITNNRTHVLLSGDNDPCLPLALRVQALGNGLQVRHQFDVVGDILPHLIDEEVQPELWPLRIDPRLHHIGKILNRDFRILAILAENILHLIAGDLRKSRCNVLAFHQRLLTSTLPRLARRLRERCLKGIELTAAIQITLELGDMWKLAIVATHLVKDLLEDGQKSINIRLRDYICLLVDIKQYRPGRNRYRLAQGPCQHRIICKLALKDFDGVLSFDFVILQQKSEHL